VRPSGSERLETGTPDEASKQASRPKGDSVSVLKRLERYISAFFKLGRTERLAKQASQAAQQNADRIASLSRELRADTKASIREQTARMEGRLAEQTLHDNELSRRLDRLLLDRVPRAAGDQTAASDTDPGETSEGFALFLDTFYNRLENRFRGSREDILNRLAVYQPDVEAAAIRTGGKPALDLGCGRGEWLELMRRLGIPASGVDLNAAQIAEAREAGLAVEELDARAALEKAEDDSLSVVSAHHLIEHIPFRDVAWIAREALRVLAPGGLLIFETPNPRNVLVGATSFHNDPTHLRPLTDPVLGVLLETAGFHPVETRFLHPHERLDEFINRPGFDPELAHLLFGPQDLAMIGQKPRASA